MFNRKKNKIKELEEIILTYHHGLNALASLDYIDPDIRSYIIYLLARDNNFPMEEKTRMSTLRTMHNIIRTGELAERYENEAH